MVISLQAGKTVGDHTVAALVETSHHFVGMGPKRHAAWFSKRPVAILIGKGQNLCAFDCKGKQITLNEVEQMCPGAVARFTNQTS